MTMFSLAFKGNRIHFTFSLFFPGGETANGRDGVPFEHNNIDMEVLKLLQGVTHHRTPGGYLVRHCSFNCKMVPLGSVRVPEFQVRGVFWGYGIDIRSAEAPCPSFIVKQRSSLLPEFWYLKKDQAGAFSLRTALRGL